MHRAEAAGIVHSRGFRKSVARSLRARSLTGDQRVTDDCAGRESGSADVYLAVKGVRDIASGLVVFILAASLATHVLGGLMLAATIIPVMDWVIVLTHHGPKATASRCARGKVMLWAYELVYALGAMRHAEPCEFAV